jgi:hypothetical protein
MHKSLLAIALMLSATAAAQQMTDTLKCGKPEQEHAIATGDQPGHVYSISHTKCTYLKPGTLAGEQTKEGADTVFTEILGERLNWRGVYVETYTNGDKLFYRHHGNGTLKNNVFDSGVDYYEVTGGSGKFKGYRGKGSCKLKGAPDGSATDECTGEYTAPK